MKKMEKPQKEQKSTRIGNLSKFIMRTGNRQDGNQKGSFEFSLGDLFKCVCCIHSGISYEEKRLNEINESLQQINKHLSLLDSQLHATKMEANSAVQSSSNANIYTKSFPMEEIIEEEVPEGIELQMSDKSDHENETYKDSDDDESDVLTQVSGVSSHDRSSNFLISPYWLQDERMRKGEVDFLSNSEEEFWKDLIAKYLRPIESDEESENKIAQELINSRDAYLSKFFMINALFVLIVFLMQLNKSILYLQWPLGMKYNITFVVKGDAYEVHMEKEYLKLEPIGCLFIVTFISILGIQFIAMLFHRFDTFAHMLASTRLPFCSKITSSEDSTFGRADKIAQGLQRMADDDLIFEFRRSTLTSPGRRRTISELTKKGPSHGPLRMLGNFEKLFRRNLRNPNASGLTRHMSTRMSKSVFEAFERRRSSILAERKRTQTQKPYDIYDDANDLRRHSNNQIFNNLQPRHSNSSQFQYDNRGFNPNENI